MAKSKSDYCIYLIISAAIAGGAAQFIIPIFIPGLDTIWLTFFAAIVGMLIGSLLLVIQDDSKSKKYRGQS